MKIHTHVSLLLIPVHVLVVMLLFSVGIQWWHVPAILFFWVLFGGIGLELGYHRILCHKQFVVSKPVEKLLSFIACFSLTGSPTFWRALHNGYHHPHSDGHRDFHSPKNRGNFHAYFGYINSLDRMKYIGCKDMLCDKFYNFINANYKKIVWSVIALSALISLDLTFVLTASMVMCYHQTAMINVLCHAPHSRIGYRNFDIKDNSKNIRWLSYLTFGQALHNNHHYSPGSHNYAMKEHEFDVGLALAKLIGLKPRQ